MLSGRITHDKDISGITKFGNTGILVSDEDSDIQILKFDKNTATIVRKTPLLTKGEEADLEAVAVSKDGWFYTAGSHGVTKKKSKPSPSREWVFRFKLTADGAISNLDRASLTPLLKALPEIADSIRRPLNQGGLNIEGLAASREKLFFGLRAPGTAAGPFIIEAPTKTLFENGIEKLKIHTVPTGSAHQIRALETLSDGSFLVLLSNQKKQALVSRWNPEHPNLNSQPHIVPKSLSGGKAEAIVIIQEPSLSIDFAILYDSVAGGAPRTFRITF